MSGIGNEKHLVWAIVPRVCYLARHLLFRAVAVGRHTPTIIYHLMNDAAGLKYGHPAHSHSLSNALPLVGRSNKTKILLVP